MADHDITPELEAAIEWLNEHLVGLDIAADCEARIQASYAPEMEEWDRLQSTKDARPNALMRKVRNCLEARSNERRYRKEAKHLRAILLAAVTLPPTEATPHGE